MFKKLTLAAAALLGLVAAQSLPAPEQLKPRAASVKVLVAPATDAVTATQYWRQRSYEIQVKFDALMNCASTNVFQQGNQIYGEAQCQGKKVVYNQGYCSTGLADKGFNVKAALDMLAQGLKGFSIYQGQVADPFFSTGLTYHRAKHATESAWIWYRTSDKAITYYQDAQGMYYIEGGLTENMFLFTQDFRLAKCNNPFLALPEMSNFAGQSQNLFSFFSNNKSPVVAASSNKKLSFFKSFITEQEAEDIGMIVDFVFLQIDLNGDGYLTKDEVREAARRNGEIVDEDQLDADWNYLDTDGDDRVSWNELYDGIAREF